MRKDVCGVVIWDLERKVSMGSIKGKSDGGQSALDHSMANLDGTYSCKQFCVSSAGRHYEGLE